MDEFFKGVVCVADIIHKRYEGKPIDKAMQNFLSTYMDGKKASLDVIVEDGEHALERVVAFNKLFEEHKHLAELDKIMESMIGHLGKHPQIIETASVKEVLKICFIGYDNRTIQIDIENCVTYVLLILQFSICITAIKLAITNAVIHNYDITPYGASEICQSHGISCVANYKHNLFGMRDAESWRKGNIPSVGERMVIYAKEGEKALVLFRDISSYLGEIVAVRKKYSQYAFQHYIFNNQQKTFEKSAVAFEKGYTIPFKEKYFGADIYFRTQSQEVSDEDLIYLGLDKGNEVTILCKPKDASGEFYRGLEEFKFENEPLFLKVEKPACFA